MHRRDGPQTPYEDYCYRCHVTFPAGTRRCVHCGGRVGRTALPEAAPAPELRVEESLPEISVGRRLGGLSLWMLLAIGAVVTRMCAGG